MSRSCRLILAFVAGFVHGGPLAPDVELASFNLADASLSVELVASEPNVISPVAITWDAEGRLFVAEMSDYPLGPGTGQIRMLEDRNRDGVYEHAIVFADRLPFPNGVLPWRDGLLVTAAPDILFLRDTNGDGRVDERRVLFTGFAEGNQQLRVNGLLWGLDGWVYGANGRNDGEVRRPGESTTVSLRGHDFRFRPDTGEFETTSGRSQFGLARDDWGNRFLSWNTIPIRQDVIPEHYLKRNPRINPAAGVQNLLAESDPGEVFPLTPAPQTFNKESTSHFNALGGLAIYRGDVLQKYRGNAFVGETLRNLVHRRVLEPSGSSFAAKRVEERKEFLASTDPWFHPVNFATGPDGALYVVDFYREWVEHPGYVPEKMRGQVAWRTGAEHGRIWRIRSSQHKLVAPEFNLRDATTQKLTGYLEYTNGWWRDTAQRLLIERGDTNAVTPLKEISVRSRAAESRVQALHTLAQLKGLDDTTLNKGLGAEHARVRQVAVQLSEKRLKTSEEIVRTVSALANDPDAAVRLQVALSIGEAAGPTRFEVLAKAAARSDLDAITVVAIRSSAGQRAWPLLETISSRASVGPRHLELIQDLASDLGHARNESDCRSLLMAISERTPSLSAEARLALFAGLCTGLAANDGQWRERIGKWTVNKERVLSSLVSLARDAISAREPVVRQIACTTLARAGTSEATASLIKLLQPRNGEQIHSSAIAAIIESGDPGIFQEAFQAWGNLQISVRRKLATGATRSSATAAVLVEALERGSVAPTELDPSARQTLSKNAGFKTRTAKIFDIPADRVAIVEKFTPALRLSGERKAGAGVFTKLCLQCHALGQRGQNLGPDLSAISSRPRETLLADILDPSRAVTPDFTSYNVVLASGETISGLITSETAESVTLRRAGVPDETLARRLIKEIRASGRSLMPDGLEAGLAPADLANLFEFLAKPDPNLLPQN